MYKTLRATDSDAGAGAGAGVHLEELKVPESVTGKPNERYRTECT